MARASGLGPPVIEEIRIRGLGVIDDAVFEPHVGFTAVTGETGAGKTMVLTGIALLLGGRADASLVRRGDSRAEVDGRWNHLPQSVVDRAADAGAELDDGTMMLARTVVAEGRSRAFLGGRPVPASVLVEISDALVAVHGQSDQMRLQEPRRQRAALDQYAGEPLTQFLMDYQAAFDRLREVESALAEIVTRSRERAQEAESLRHGLIEIDLVAPISGEVEATSIEAARLSHAELLRDAAAAAHEALSGEDDGARGTDALELVSEARRVLDAQRQHDPELGAIADRVADAAAQLRDVAGELASYVSAADADPIRLAAVEERRAALSRLTRAYGPTVDDVLSWARDASERLLILEGDDERRSALDEDRVSLRSELSRLAAGISELRRTAADRFAAEVTAELSALAMAGAHVTVELRHADRADGLEVVLDGRARSVAFGRSGVDEVEILLVAHPGAPPRPLGKGASGGELSRVMLALEVVLAGKDPVPTLVFDEIDAGVGGKAAVEVGRRLARLARSSQVLVVTHLPQVAAFADRQIVVEKSQDGRVTTAGLRTLAEGERVRELARMLAGLEESDSAAAHAQELLELANAERPSSGQARPSAG